MARTTDGEVADLASPEFQRAVAAINALNETQWAMVNNDLMAMISSLVDTSQLADSHELSSQSSGLILYANLRMQMLSAATRSVNYTDQILLGAAKPKLNQKDFLQTLHQMELAIHREQLVNKLATV